MEKTKSPVVQSSTVKAYEPLAVKVLDTMDLKRSEEEKDKSLSTPLASSIRLPSTLRISLYVGDDDLREPGRPRIEMLAAFAATGLDRLACFPGRWDTSVEGQERFAQDCEAAGIVLDGP